MSGRPRVSVLMTAYNAAPYLREAIDSLVHQTFTDWELIVFENGSTDESAGILASYADRRIRVTSSPTNIGRTPALRRAFDLAQSEYFAVLDADDRALPERLNRQVTYLDSHPDVVLVGTWVRYLDIKGQAIGSLTPPTDPAELSRAIGCGNPIVHSSAMYRARAAAEVGGYPATLPYAQDFGLWLRLAQRGTVAMIGEYLCEQRVLQQSMTNRREHRLDAMGDYIELLGYARAHLALGPEALRRNLEESTISHVKYGLALIKNGRRAEGYRWIWRAFLNHPTGFLRNRVVLKHWSRQARQ